MKPKPDSSMQRRHRLGREVDARSERLEQVGRAGAARRRAVAVLGDRAAGARRDQGGRGRDVEGAAPAAGPGRVEQVLRGRSARARPARASSVPGPASSSTVSPFVRSAIRKPAIWTSETSPCMISASTAGGLLARSDRARRRRASIAAVRVGLGIERCSRKFASSSWPCSVRTDSGWNWTPSAGSSRWRMRHQHAAAAGGGLQAVGQLLVDDQRVVAPDRQRRAGPRKIVRPSCSIVVALPWTGSCSSHRPAEGLGERLVAEADPERRDPRLGHAPRRPRARCRPASGVHGPGETTQRS